MLFTDNVEDNSVSSTIKKFLRGLFLGEVSDRNDRGNRIVALTTAIMSLGIGEVIFLYYPDINIGIVDGYMEYTALIFLLGGAFLLIVAFFTSPKKDQKSVCLRILGACITIIFCCYVSTYYASTEWHVTVPWINNLFQFLPLFIWVLYVYIVIYEAILLFFDLKES